MSSKRFYILVHDWGAELCDGGEVIMSSYHQNVLGDVCDLLNNQEDLINELYKKVRVQDEIIENLQEQVRIQDQIDGLEG